MLDPLAGMQNFLGVLGLMAVAACASPSPLADKQSDDAGKRFDPPPPGLATLYVYQKGTCAASTLQPIGTVAVFQPGNCRQVKVELEDDNRQVQSIGALDPRTWLSLQVPPGAYTVRCAAVKGSIANVRMAAGDSFFVRIFPTANGECWAMHVGNPEGRDGVLEGRRIVPSAAQ